MQLTKHWAVPLDDYVIDLAWSPDGTRLAACSAAGSVVVQAVEDGARIHALPGHEDGANAVSWSPDGLHLASGGQDGKVKLWDPVAGQHTATSGFERVWVEHLAWRPASADAQGEPLLAAAAGRHLRVLRADASTAHDFDPAPKTISALAWGPGGAGLAAAFFGGVRIWDADARALRKEFPYANGIHALVWSPDGKWLVSGNQDPSVHLWIPATGVELHMSGYEGKVKDLTFDHTSRWLATGGGPDACVWDCRGGGPEGREPVMLPHEARVCAVAFQNRHGLLATASEDGIVMIWSPDRAQPMRARVSMPAAATRLAWSPDDRHLAVGNGKGSLFVLKSDA